MDYNVWMNRIFPRFAALALIAALTALLSGCDAGDAPPPARTADSPEIKHCLIAVERLARDFEDVKVVRVRDWEVEKILNVAVTYDYTIPAQGTAIEAESLQGLAVCRYDYPLVVRNKPKRKVKALAIRFRGRPLSPNELILLDTVISSRKPRLTF